MDRLSIATAIKLYEGSMRPANMRCGRNFLEYEEEMKSITPALVGAMLKLDLKSISAPQIGSSLPIIVLRYPVIRIIVDPIAGKYNTKKGQEHLRVSARNYSGDQFTLDTAKEYHDKFDNNAAKHSISKHLALWESIELGVERPPAA